VMFSDYVLQPQGMHPYQKESTEFLECKFQLEIKKYN